MSKETKKIELTEQELDQVAGGMRKPGSVKGNNKDSPEPDSVAPIAPVVRPIVRKPSAS